MRGTGQLACMAAIICKYNLDEIFELNNWYNQACVEE